MKRSVAWLALSAAAVWAMAQYPRTVQGVPYTPKETGAGVAAFSGYPDDPDDLAVPESEFTFDMIESWSGEGSNRAALVIQWNDPAETNALVFGYRWDGLATGADMIRAVVASHPQLYALIQYTNVSSPTDPLGGYTINGFGWDRDGDGDIALKDTKDNQIYYSENGLFIHPRGYDPDKGGSSDYDYDDWMAVDDDDFWGAGWYLSYWSYWVKSSQDAAFSYSGWGASGRVLDDGCWDGWNFSLEMMPRDWKNFKAAPDPMPIDVATQFKVNGLYYTLTNYASRKVVLTAPFEMDGENLTAYAGDINVPATITVEGETYNVTEIKANAFEGAGIGNVAIPSSVTKIGDYAFLNSTIKGLSLAEGMPVPSLGKGAFSGCSQFAQFMLPAEAKIVPDEIFKGTAITEILLDGIESIGASCFENCKSITSVVFPETIKAIGEKSFSGCTSLASASVSVVFPPSCAVDAFGAGAAASASLKVPMGCSHAFASAQGWSAFAKFEEYAIPVNVGDRFASDGIAYIVTAADGDNMAVKVTYQKTQDNKTDTSSIKDANKAGYTGYVTIPDSVAYQSKKLRVAAIDDKAFYGANQMLSISLPAGISLIPAYAFYDCTHLKSIDIPSTVKEIGNYGFAYCDSLDYITLPNTLATLGQRAFMASGIKSISIPDSVTSLPSYCFYGSALSAAVIGEQITSIGTYCFSNCKNLTEINLPSKLASLPASIFYGCSSLEKVTMSPGITAITQSAFANCAKLHTIAYHGDSVPNTPGIIRLSPMTKTIAQYAFQGCSSITDIVLPDGFTGITGREPLKKTGISRLVIPASVTSMNQNYICGDNEKVTFYICSTAPTTVNRFTFAKASGKYDFPIVVPTGCADTYKAASNWNYYSISEPAAESLSLSEMKLLDDSTLTGRLGVNYDMELPERFAMANNAIALEGYAFKVTLCCEGADSACVEITPAADGTFSATIDNFKCRTGVTAIAHAINERNSFASDSAAVEVLLTVPFAFVEDEYNAHFDEQYAPEIVFENDTYSLDSLSFSSSDSEVAHVNKRTGLVNVKRKEGDAVIRAYVTADPDRYAEMTIHAALAKPVEKFILGDGSKDITISYMDIYALCPTVEPADADIQSYDLAISDPEIATTYSVTAFNPTRKYFELVTHKPGEVDVTFKAQDGSDVSTTYHFTITDSDRSAAKDSWQDGTFWLNEDWFGHTNGSINYIEKDGTVRYRAYESQNPCESFGCTSQYAMIFGGKLYVMSKQPTDGGDPRTGGGRLVVADAKTLKNLAGFDDVLDGGDGRACVGVNASKVYIGTTAGIAVFNPETLSITGKVDGLEAGSQYANQLGDMVCAGKYVFAIKQAYGTCVIDTETDAVVATLGRNENGTVFANPQGVAMTADGMVWIAATSTANGNATTLYCYDPADLSLVQSVEMPSHLSITCGWGAWRSTNFFTEKKNVALWFGSGVEASIVSGNSGYYRWDTKSDLAALEPVFVFPADMAGIDGNTMQAPYASARYDDRSNQLLIAATHGSSSNYRYTWLHFVDCKTGEIANTVRLKDYYWFPAMPVFPDKFAPEFDGLGDLELDLATDSAGLSVDVIVTDPDNMDCAIALSLDDSAIAGSESEDDAPIASASLSGRTLKIVPLNAGSGEIEIKAESNGIATFMSVPVNVIDTSLGITDKCGDGAVMSVTGRRFHAVGFNGHTMRVYSTAGALVAEFEVVDDDFSLVLPMETGLYVISDINSKRTLKCFIK